MFISAGADWLTKSWWDEPLSKVFQKISGTNLGNADQKRKKKVMVGAAY
jgi:hypothetical protein